MSYKFFSSDVDCPYCGEGVEIDHDDGYGYEQDRTFEQYCSSCDKLFAFTTSIHFFYDVKKADCMNDGDHNFKPTRTWPKFHTRMRCEDCDEERQLTEIEWFDLMVPMEVISGWYQ